MRINVQPLAHREIERQSDTTQPFRRARPDFLVFVGGEVLCAAHTLDECKQRALAHRVGEPALRVEHYAVDAPLRTWTYDHRSGEWDEMSWA